MSKRRSAVGAVIVNPYHGKLPRIILCCQRTDYRLYRGSLIPCGNDRCYARPLCRSRESRAMGIEFPDLPEISPRKKQDHPNYEYEERNENQHLDWAC